MKSTSAEWPCLGNKRFNILTRYLEKIQSLKRKKKNEFTMNFFSKLIFIDSACRKESFLILRLLLPQIDRERSNYNLKEKNLGKLIAKVYGLKKLDEDSIIHYKNPAYQPSNSVGVGDFVAIIQRIISPLSSPDSTLTLEETDSFLDSLAFSIDTESRVKSFMKIVSKISSTDLIWLLRIILKDLKLGIKHETILSIYHPMAAKLFNSVADLRKVCEQCVDPSKKVFSTLLYIFIPLRPYIAKRVDHTKIGSIFMSTEFILETKYDGERMQLHFDETDIKFFSRNCLDATYLYLPHFKNIVRKQINADCAILDGEMIVVKRSTLEPVEFGLNRTVAQSVDDQEHQLCFKIFDILYVRSKQGQSVDLVNEKVSLLKRKALLLRIINPLIGRFEPVEGVRESKLAAITARFSKAIKAKEEGIIIKKIDSLYTPGERNESWIKLKGDYYDGLVPSIDVLVIGGYFGTGTVKIGDMNRWESHITHFLLGLRRNDDKLEPFCKVGSGLDKKELEMLRSSLTGNFLQINPSQKERVSYPEYYSFTDFQSQDRPDAIVLDYKKSVVLQIRGSEIIHSSNYAFPYTLRFPRTDRIRDDKTWEDAMTSNEFIQIVEEGQSRLKKDHPGAINSSDSSCDESADNLITKPKKRVLPNITSKSNRLKKVSKPAKTAQIYEDYIIPNTLGALKVTSSLLSGLEMIIVNPGDEHTTSELQALVIKNGGKIVLNCTPLTKIAISAVKDFRTRALHSRFLISVITPNWLTSSCEAQILQDYEPRYILYSSNWLEARNIANFDSFGDSYTVPLTPSKFKALRESCAKKLNLSTVNTISDLRIRPFYQKTVKLGSFSRLGAMEMIQAMIEALGGQKWTPNKKLDIFIVPKVEGARTADLLSQVQYRGDVEVLGVEDVVEAAGFRGEWRWLAE